MADYNQNPYFHEHIDKHQKSEAPKKDRNFYATASLICGILSLITLCCFAFTTAIVFGVGAISIAIISKKDNRLSIPARIAIFLGSGAIAFGFLEFFYALKLFEYIKKPENIAMFNQFFQQAEQLLEGQPLLKGTLK